LNLWCAISINSALLDPLKVTTGVRCRPLAPPQGRIKRSHTPITLPLRVAMAAATCGRPRGAIGSEACWIPRLARHSWSGVVACAAPAARSIGLVACRSLCLPDTCGLTSILGWDRQSG
jgi:hypothetical protein